MELKKEDFEKFWNSLNRDGKRKFVWNVIHKKGLTRK